MIHKQFFNMKNKLFGSYRLQKFALLETIKETTLMWSQTS